MTNRDEPPFREALTKDALAVEHEIQRLMLERLGIEWTPGEPFYSLIEAEIERLREEMAEWKSAHAAVTELRGLVESHMDMARGEWECVAAIERLRAAILAYDDAIRKASWRGQRVIDDDDNLDERYAEMLLAAGREPEAT